MGRRTPGTAGSPDTKESDDKYPPAGYLSLVSIELLQIPPNEACRYCCLRPLLSPGLAGRAVLLKAWVITLCLQDSGANQARASRSCCWAGHPGQFRKNLFLYSLQLYWPL